MAINADKYTKYIKDNSSLFYTESSSSNKKNFFNIIGFDKNMWTTKIDKNWHYMLYDKDKIPDQGWKIHISANIDDAKEVLMNVSDFLIKRKISFKFIPSYYDLLISYSKSNDRVESGKFITIYPYSDEEFCELLDPLKEITSKFKEGPYILNDCPWKQSNVYFRYGAFREMMSLKNGVPVYAIKAPNGKYIEDKREPYYSNPDFINEPSFVVNNNVFPEKNEFNEIKELNIKDAIHFSTSGGIYNGNYHGQNVIIKEGRPNIGLSGDFRDGFTRVLDEYNTLKKLVHVKDVVKPLGYKKIWKHNYLIEEKIDGITLGDYLSLRFPFANQLTNKIADYKKNTVKIINSLIQTIQEIHSKGVAFVDFQPENIIVNTNHGKVTVKLIDFESSKSIDEKYSPDLVIPDYASYQSKNYGDADWYALYRIARTLFLPIEPTLIYSKELEKRQNKNIKSKFGQEIVDYLIEVRKICQQHTVIYRSPAFYKGDLKIPSSSISRKNIGININSLIDGVLSNVKYSTNELIHGDVGQYDSSLSKYTINYGAMGAIMAIDRADSSKLKNNKFETWLRKSIDNIFEIVKTDSTSKIGLYDGLSGIAVILYDLGKTETAKKLFKYCSVDRKQLDISIYSGLSGIGLANLSFYSETKDKIYQSNAIKIANIIIGRYEDHELDTQDDYEGKYSLIKGWAGVVLFLWKVGILLNVQSFKIKALEVLDKIIDKGIVDSERGISLLDKNKKLQRLLPYLDTGFAGISLLLIDMLIDDHDYISQKYGYLLNSLKTDAGSFCAYCASLFSGVSGLIVSGNAVYQYFSQDSYLDNYINSLNNYAVSLTGDDILIPGLLGVKCSMDYETGASGIILALIDYKENNGSWYSWFPLLKSNKLNIFNCNSTSK